MLPHPPLAHTPSSEFSATRAPARRALPKRPPPRRPRTRASARAIARTALDLAARCVPFDSSLRHLWILSAWWGGERGDAREVQVRERQADTDVSCSTGRTISLAPILTDAFSCALASPSAPTASVLPAPRRKRRRRPRAARARRAAACVTHLLQRVLARPVD